VRRIIGSMDTLAKSDIFFVIASLSVIIITIFVATIGTIVVVMLLRLRKAARDARWRYKFLLRFVQKFIR
jgi:hypothetical protein